MSLLEEMLFNIVWLGIFGWAFWFISIPMVAVFIFMARRKKTGRAGKIIYSICALLFLLPMLSLPFAASDFGIFPPSMD
ncbi:hypothetical protein [Xenorhabdus bharatensis]|uniref:hypothetical protein n=1 Tax=Xenorhabdus bharatensis TaxID=3136256 RepID=UPI0030F3A74D